MTALTVAEANVAAKAAVCAESATYVAALDRSGDVQFNPAAVALETAWLALLDDSGCLTDDQRELPANGLADHTRALQQASGLPQTGTTEAALRTTLAAEGGATAQQETASTAAVQQTLKLAGFWDGPVDGKWTGALTDSLEADQGDLGVRVTGSVDAVTIAALEQAIADAQPSPSPSQPSPSAEPTGADPSASIGELR